MGLLGRALLNTLFVLPIAYMYVYRVTFPWSEHTIHAFLSLQKLLIPNIQHVLC